MSAVPFAALPEHPFEETLRHIDPSEPGAALAQRLFQAIVSVNLDDPDEPAFEALALDVARFQLEHNLPYKRFAKSRGITAASITDWREAPPVPTDVFKVTDLIACARDRVVATFRTSGTTGGQGGNQGRGQHHFRTLALYEAGILPTFSRYMLPDQEGETRLPLLSLIPSPLDLPDSSLSHMVGYLMPRIGGPGSDYFIVGTDLQAERLRKVLEDFTAQQQPVMLLGTAFSFVYLLDALENWSIKLPPGSRVMETGGLKGRVKEVPRVELYQRITARLGLPSSMIVAEYGMTELSSQLYDSVLRSRVLGNTQPRRLMPPPWLAVAVVNPATLKPVPQGEQGLVRFFDLANLFSVSAIVTSDRGRWADGGLELLGRAPDAEARGCSLTTEELLEFSKSTDRSQPVRPDSGSRP